MVAMTAASVFMVVAKIFMTVRAMVGGGSVLSRAEQCRTQQLTGK
jgi:hypothetical protein